jgi:hypothetical protein
METTGCIDGDAGIVERFRGMGSNPVWIWIVYPHEVGNLTAAPSASAFLRPSMTGAAFVLPQSRKTLSRRQFSCGLPQIESVGRLRPEFRPNTLYHNGTEIASN